jgi:nitronate monooxygenase
VRSWLTRTLGVDVPVVQAPMARVAGGRLAAAVSAAGGLGMIGAGAIASPEWFAEEARLASSAGRPWGVGLMAWALPDNPALLRAVADSDAAVVSVSFGAYADAVRLLQGAGKTVGTQVGNVEEASRAADAGVDFIVARGGEGGGHGRNEVATLPLLQLVLDAVEAYDVPVLAAGGIGSARGLAAVLAAGADGAWVGTAFLTCTESASSPEARARLAAGGDTVYGRVFDVAQRAAWPREYGGRSLRNAFFDRWQGREDELAGDASAAEDYARAAAERDFDTAVIYAGEGAALLGRETTAAEVVSSFAVAERHLRRALEG